MVERWWETATFAEFLESIANHYPETREQDIHWEPYWSACYPCDIQYDYILKLETIEEDSEWLLRHIGVDQARVDIME